MFRPDNPLLPNYKWVPIGYHGRASSIVPSGTDVRRPRGQTRDGNEGTPVFGASKRLDYELEIGAFIGAGNAIGTPIEIGNHRQHFFRGDGFRRRQLVAEDSNFAAGLDLAANVDFRSRVVADQNHRQARPAI
jgi:hypothetical protein